MPDRQKSARRPPARPPDRETYTIERVDQLKALTHPLRQRLFEQFARAPRTTKQAAERMGEKATRLYHHVAALEKAGLVTLVSTRPVRGTTEKYYAAVAQRVRIDPALLAGQAEAALVQSAGLDVVDGVLGNVRRDIAELLGSKCDEDGEPHREEEVMFTRVDVAGSDEDVQRARARIDALLAELGAAAPDGDAGSHRVVIGWYPVPGARSRRREGK